MNRPVVLASLLLSVCSAIGADYDESPFLPLWPEAKMPGKTTPGPEVSKGQFQKGKDFQGFVIENVSTPTLQFFRAKADQPTPAIIVCPGGAYRGLQYGHEGVDIARYLSEMGVSAFILKYRVPNEFKDKDRVFMDAQRAIHLVRYHAKEWNVDTGRVGFIGFSAGGHLAAWMSTHYRTEMYPAIDEADATPMRPDFVAMVYPAWLNAREGKKELLTCAEDLPVTDETPPAFIVQNLEDKSFYRGSLAYFLAMEEHHIPGELHMFQAGGHGHGIHKTSKTVDQWFPLFTQWLKFHLKINGK